MHILTRIGEFLASGILLSAAAGSFVQSSFDASTRANVIAPKVVIVSMYPSEAVVWHNAPDLDILAQNFTVPGLSPLDPDVHCTADGEVCQLTIGEGEINAAVSITALAFSSKFDLSKCYFLIAGVAGINPQIATTGSVTFAKYAVQVALQYEIDAREVQGNFTTGYFPQGALSPSMYPQAIYGTEVFELNEALRDYAIGFASSATLNDSSAASAYRSNYASDDGMYEAATRPPCVVACDVTTADNFWSGNLLAEAFDNTTTLFTNGSGVYCTTAQEDNGILEALVRSSLYNLTDFARIIVMRTGSDFDRPYPGEDAITHLLYAEQGGYGPALNNIFLAGFRVVTGILNGWDEVFGKGVQPKNYVGDIFATLGGSPDFGLPAFYLNDESTGLKSRQSIKARKLGRLR